MVRYQSLSMPVMVLSETNMDEKDEKINVVNECEKTNEKKINAISNNTDSKNCLNKER